MKFWKWLTTENTGYRFCLLSKPHLEDKLVSFEVLSRYITEKWILFFVAINL